MAFTKRIKAKDPTLQSVTIRDFTGGWNLLDNDLNLDTKFSRKMFNCCVLADGTVTTRYGTTLFANLVSHMSSAGATIINMEYFSSALIVVLSNGDVLSVLGDGTVARIWDSGIAAALPGAPTGWSATAFASFAQFNSTLVICNGVDKPLTVSTSLAIGYLADLGTGSNLNVPICKYVTVCDRYLVMSGDPVNVNRIHFSSRDTSGTFFGDAPPNDGTFIDVGSMLNNSSFIRGICSFRGKLIVGFVEGTLTATLGEYDVDGNHTPTFDNPVEQYGAACHRSMLSYGDDILMMDLVGIPSLKRTVFTGTLRPERVSDLVDTEMAALLNTLSFSSIEDRCFAVYNQKEGQFLFFIPNADAIGSTTSTPAYVYLYRPALHKSGWARFDGWNFTCGVRSIHGEVFFGDANGKIWHYGSLNDPTYEDFLDDPSQDSVPIVFDWELPWADLENRTKTKTSKYLKLDTAGTADFNVNMYVDRFTMNALGADIPYLSMAMTAGDTAAYGGGDQPFGAGRNTADELLYAWPAKFNLMKLRFTGQTTGPLKFISISLLFQKGKVYR